MPDFVAALTAAALFCAGLLVLNALTRLALALHVAPADLAENSFAHYALALALAALAWRRTLRGPSV